ncbi:hypothetical protein INS49_004194 [Diaporthe citri]|uniref:uncharacterized protein n=1 Tax=Diaporthe citri TaxID=83186 RepID=UPI001C814385|nr:uncharacterized protein INS49_004194 [Diaporthe citri]KAG6355113.1 hypothetical protein INS49_004194 [Diaporthe citri]
MASQGDTVFPLIPAPMALAVDTFSAATSARRSPVPSRSTASANRTMTPPTPAPAASAATSPTTTSNRAKNPRHPIFNEDIFSRLYSTPFMVLLFAFYGAVPFYYLLHYSPFRDFDSGVVNEVVKWSLFVLTQYITAVIVTSWGGRYRLQKDVTACALMLVCLAGATWSKASLDGMAVSKG